MKDKLTYEQGAAMGYRLGITFALRSLQIMLADDDPDEETFDYIAGQIWNNYLTNPEFLYEEIERQIEWFNAKNKKQEPEQLQMDELLKTLDSNRKDDDI